MCSLHRAARPPGSERLTLASPWLLSRATLTVNGAVFSPDGRLVLTASADDTALLWELGNREPLVTFPGPHRRGYERGLQSGWPPCSYFLQHRTTKPRGSGPYFRLVFLH